MKDRTELSKKIDLIKDILSGNSYSDISYAIKKLKSDMEAKLEGSEVVFEKNETEKEETERLLNQKALSELHQLFREISTS